MGDNLKETKKETMQQVVPKLATKTALEINNILLDAENAFNYRRRLEIQGIPPRLSKEDVTRIMLKNFQHDDIYKSNDGRMHILFSTPHQAELAFQEFKGKNFNDQPMFTCYSQSTFLMFVGNIPYEYTVQQFHQLMEPYGKIERIFIVPCETTGQSKGYGFVEFVNKNDADRAKQEFKLSLNDRNLRIDYANYGIFEYAHVHSTTLFIDKFPPQTTDQDLKDLFNTVARPTFCQIAANPINKKQRNFALVDFNNPRDAEAVWFKCDGAVINDSAIRISFASPARTGASIIGGQPNRTPQIQNVPVPRSIFKLTDGPPNEKEDSPQSVGWKNWQDTTTTHTKDIPPLMGSQDGSNFQFTGPKNHFRPRRNFNTPRPLLQSQTRSQTRPPRPHGARFQRGPQQPENRFPSPHHPSGNRNFYNGPNQNSSLRNETQDFNKIIENNAPSYSNMNQHNLSNFPRDVSSSPVSRFPTPMNANNQQSNFNNPNTDNMQGVYNYPPNFNYPPTSNWKSQPFNPGNNQLQSQLPAGPQQPYNNMQESYSVQSGNWNNQFSQQNNPSNIPSSIGENYSSNFTQNQTYNQSFNQQRMSQPQTNNNVPPSTPQNVFAQPNPETPYSMQSPMPLPSTQFQPSFQTGSVSNQPLPSLSGRALAAAQQYIQYYQQYYMSTMGNMPGFDMAATLAQITSFAYQYYAQCYGQNSSAGNSTASMSSTMQPQVQHQPSMPPIQNNMSSFSNSSSSGTFASTPENTASYLLPPGPSYPPNPQSSYATSQSTSINQGAPSQRNSQTVNASPRPIAPWQQSDQTKIISQSTNQLQGSSYQSPSLYQRHSNQAQFQQNPNINRSGFQDSSIHPTNNLPNYQDYNPAPAYRSQESRTNVPSNHQSFNSQTSNSFSPFRQSESYTPQAQLNSSELSVASQNLPTQQYENVSQSAFPSSYQQQRFDSFPSKRPLDGGTPSMQSAHASSFQQHGSFSNPARNNPERLPAKRPYPAPHDHVTKKPHWLN